MDPFYQLNFLHANIQWTHFILEDIAQLDEEFSFSTAPPFFAFELSSILF